MFKISSIRKKQEEHQKDFLNYFSNEQGIFNFLLINSENEIRFHRNVANICLY